MYPAFGRRRLVSAFALAGPALACTRLVQAQGQTAPSPRIDAPVVDSLSIQVVTDGAHDVFISGAQAPGVRVERTRGFSGTQLDRTLRSEWGLSLFLTAHMGGETRRYLLDFGWTPEVLNNNLELLQVDVPRIDALISSHGHYDRHAAARPNRIDQRRQHAPLPIGQNGCVPCASARVTARSSGISMSQTRPVLSH